MFGQFGKCEEVVISFLACGTSVWRGKERESSGTERKVRGMREFK